MLIVIGLSVISCIGALTGAHHITPSCFPMLTNKEATMLTLKSKSLVYQSACREKAEGTLQHMCVWLASLRVEVHSTVNPYGSGGQ